MSSWLRTVRTQKPPRLPSTARTVAFCCVLQRGALRRAPLERGASSYLDALPQFEAAGALPMCRANDPRCHPYVTGADVDQASAAVLAALLFPCATLGILQGDFCGLTSAMAPQPAFRWKPARVPSAWQVRPRRRKAHHLIPKKQESATTATATIPMTTDGARLLGGCCPLDGYPCFGFSCQRSARPCLAPSGGRKAIVDS